MVLTFQTVPGSKGSLTSTALSQVYQDGLDGTFAGEKILVTSPGNHSDASYIPGFHTTAPSRTPLLNVIDLHVSLALFRLYSPFFKTACRYF